MSIPFWKMHGAGNDFILVDARTGNFPAHDISFRTHLCDRRKGIGSDGLILLLDSDVAHFKMQFFNPDGSEADLCGNGARCLARLAHEIKVAPAEMCMETRAGIIRAEVCPAGIRIHLPPPKDERSDISIQWKNRPLALDFVNTGVPHAVVLVEDLAALDVAPLGAYIRHHEQFAPAGTNANFIQVRSPQFIAIRTFERGVEGETLACGTGIVAAALVAAKHGLVNAPVQVQAASGDLLEVGFSPLTLTGPAEHSFRGTLP